MSRLFVRGNSVVSSRCPALSHSTLTAYLFALPEAGLLLMAVPVSVVMAGLYAKEYGISLVALGTAMALVRISDAITDPLIGWLSDRQQVKVGSRKLLIVVGAIVMLLSTAAIIFPLTTVTISYLTLWCVLFYIGYTCFVLPHRAWSHEVTMSSEEKVLLFSRVTLFATAGRLGFFLLPFLPFFATSSITSDTLAVAFGLGAPLFIIATLILLFVVPNGKSAVGGKAQYVSPTFTPSQNNNENSPSLSLYRSLIHGFITVKAHIAAMLKNGLFVRYTLANLLFWLGVGMSGGLMFIYIDVFLYLGEQYASTMFLGIGCSLVSYLVWQRLSHYIDKVVIYCLCSLAAVAPFVLVLFMQPGATWSLYGLYTLFVIQQVAYAGTMVVGNPILCDIIDYGRLKDTAERTGQYFSIYGFLLKIEGGLATALGLMVVGWFGFNAQAAVQSKQAILGLHLTMAWVPILLAVIAVWLMWRMPLREHRVTIIRKRLQERNERAKRQLSAVANSSHLHKPNKQAQKQASQIC